jgi:hypothetical protein
MARRQGQFDWGDAVDCGEAAVGETTAGIDDGNRSDPDTRATNALGYAAAAQPAIESLINRYVRPEQTKGRRRRPYGHWRRIVYL